jgi:hypothetical protein
MDLGYPYSEEEIRDRAIRCKKYKRHLLEMKEVFDMNLRDYRRRQEEPKRVLIMRVPEQPTPVVVQEPIAAPASAKVYKVERIFKDHCKVVYRKQKPHKKYFVKWTGYTSCTWQYKSALIKDLGYYVFNKLLF